MTATTLFQNNVRVFKINLYFRYWRESFVYCVVFRVHFTGLFWNVKGKTKKQINLTIHHTSGGITETFQDDCPRQKFVRIKYLILACRYNNYSKIWLIKWGLIFISTNKILKWMVKGKSVFTFPFNINILAVGWLEKGFCLVSKKCSCHHCTTPSLCIGVSHYMTLKNNRITCFLWQV